MTIQDFSEFLHSAEHSGALRREIKECRDFQNLKEVAAKYGFSIAIKDLDTDPKHQKIEHWFESSKIAPIKNSKN